jgi:histidyl-tRNA synthetase
VVLHAGGGSFKSQMKKADRSGARYAAILGDDEALAGEISIKPLLSTGEQKRCKLNEVRTFII